MVQAKGIDAQLIIPGIPGKRNDMKWHNKYNGEHFTWFSGDTVTRPVLVKKLVGTTVAQSGRNDQEIHYRLYWARELS